MKLLLIGIGGLCLLAGLLEGVLRAGFGFGRPPLYVADDTMGYRLAPSQRTRRFGNLIEINEYSMRAGAIAPKPDPGTFRLLLLGDSLANGNWWTDQSEILSVKMAATLQAQLPARYAQVEPLNASANSWGPRNQLAYLERYGLFESSVLVLLLNTDDFFGTQPTPVQVGRDPNYPNRLPVLAIAEVLTKVLGKSPQIPELAAIQAADEDRVGANLSAIAGIYQRAIAADVPFVLVLSPLKRELPGPRDYELVARGRLQDWTDAHGVTYLDLLSEFQQTPEREGLYRDHIHLSPRGNDLVSERVASAIAANSISPR